MATFRCVICTPTAKLIDIDATYASVPSGEGMFGVLPGHELLVALTGRGGLCTVTEGEGGAKREFLVFKGASQMFNGILTVLASYGIEAKDIDREEVEEHARGLKERLLSLEDAEDNTQNRTRRAIFRRNLEWDEFQLEYLAKAGA